MKYHLVIFTLISLLLGGCGGGGGDNGGPGKPQPPVTTMFLGTPATVPAVIPPSSVATQITFLSMVTGTALPPDALQLDEINADGAVIQANVAQLRDDGQRADQKRGDRIFTGTLNISSINAVEKNYRVSTVFNGDTIASNAMNFWVSGCPTTSRPSDPAQAVFDGASSSTIFANEVMLRTLADVPPDLDAINAIAAQAGGYVVGCIPALRQYLLEITNPNNPADAAGVYTAISTLRAQPGVETAFPNGQSLAVPASPLTSSLLCSGVVNSQCQWYLDRIRAPQAWQLAGGGDPQMAVAMIDFGVDCALNGLPCDATLYHQDPIDHGTGVAGLIASPDNPTGMVGAAYNTHLYPYNFLGSSGSQYKMNELITAALSQTAVRVINVSAGTGADFDGQIKAAVCNAIGSGRLVVAAAGNPTGADAASCQLTNVFPARYSSPEEQCANGADLQGGLIVVGATDINNGLASWSDNGQTYCSNQEYVKLYAPGKDIVTLSTVSGYTTKSGTSYAAPLVSAAAAVVWAARPGDTPRQIHDQLINSAGSLDLSSSNPRLQTGDNRMAGKPLLDMYRAVGGVDSIPTPDTTPDPFTIAAATDAPLQADVASEPFTVSGIDSPTPISITGGYYRINNGPFTNAAGSVRNGDSIVLQLSSAATPTTTSTATLTIGGQSETFSITTRDPLTTPGSFTFPAQTSVSNGSVVVSDPQTITGIDPGTPISITGGEYTLDGGATYTSAPGTIDSGQSVQVRVTSPVDFASTTEATLTIGTVSSAFVVETPPADITPDPFTLDTLTGVAPATQVTSTPFTISGLNTAAVISVSAGEYSLDNGLTYTRAAGSVGNGQSVMLRLTSSAISNAGVTTTLTIGTVSGVFTVITMTLDTVPDSFSLAAQSDVTPGSVVTSNTVTVSGINTAVPISVSGGDGQYAIDAGQGGAFTNAPGTISAGQTVTLRVTAPASLATAVTVTVTIGGASGNFIVSTAGADTTPDPWSFTAQSNAPLSSSIMSNTVNITGINTTAPVSISGGAYSVNGAPFTNAPGTINNGNTVQVRLTSAATADTTSTATLTIGGANAGFSVTTVAADTTPDAISFDAQTGVPLSTQVTSNSVIITGINTAASISITGSGAQYAVNGGGFTNAAGTVNNNDAVQVRQTSSANPATTTTATLTIGGVSGSFTVTTVPVDTTPDAFALTAQTAVALGTVATSNTVTVMGINSAASISISAGGTYSINGGAYTSTAGTVANGQTVSVRQTSSATPATTTTVTLTIGGVSGSFSVTTVPADTTPDAFAFTAQAGVALSTVVTSNTITVNGINTAASISISAGGTYSINGGAYTSTAGTVTNGQTVSVRLTSSAIPATTTTVTLTIGGVVGGFSVTTVNSYTVTAIAGTGGTIAPASVSVNQGSTTSFIVTANAGYSISNISGCGGPAVNNVTSPYTYTTGVISAACTVNASFVSSDMTPPTLISVSPINLDNRVAINQPFILNFSETLDPNSVTASNFTLYQNGIPLPFTVSVVDTQVRFAANSNFDFATSYTAQFNGQVTDLAGNPVTVNHSWSVTTMAAPVVISPETYATISAHAYHQDEAGNILLVWYEHSGSSAVAYYRYYTAVSQSWSLPQPLGAGYLENIQIAHDNNGMLLSYGASSLCSRYFNGSTFTAEVCHSEIHYYEYKVSSNGDGFLLVGRDRSNVGDVYAKFYSSATNTWSGATALEQGAGASYGYITASNNAGYAVMWYQQFTDANNVSTYDLIARVYEGTGWGPATTLVSGSLSYLGFKMAANSLGYAMVWNVDNHIYANYYNNGISNITQLDDPASSASGPVVLATPLEFIVAWSESNVVRSNIFSQGVWTGAGTVVNSAGTKEVTSLTAGSNSQLLTFTSYIFPDRQLQAIRYNGSSWDASAALLDTASYQSYFYPRVVANGDRYAVVWTRSNTGGSQGELYASTYDSGWGATIRHDSNSDPYFSMAPSIFVTDTGYVAAWLQSDGNGNAFHFSRHTIATSAWAAEPGTPLVPVRRGDALSVKLVSNSAGTTVALWKQVAGEKLKVYYSIRNGANWSEATWLSECGSANDGLDAISNGATFMIVCAPWNGTGSYSNTSQIAYLLTDSTLTPAQQIVANGAWINRQDYIATDGTDYAVAVATFDNTISVNVYNNVTGLWSGEQVVTTVPSYLYAAVKIAGNNTGFMASWWRSQFGTYEAPFALFASNYENGVWDAPIQINTTPRNNYTYDQFVPNSLETNGSDYVLTWNSENGTFTSRYSLLNGAWDSEYQLSTIPQNGYAYNYASAVLGNGQNTVRLSSNGYVSSIFDGMSWAHTTIVNNAYQVDALDTDTNQSGYANVWTQQAVYQGTFNAYMARHENGLWTTPLLLESSPASAYLTDIIATGSRYRAIWTQGDPNFTIDPDARRVWVSGEF